MRALIGWPGLVEMSGWRALFAAFAALLLAVALLAGGMPGGPAGVEAAGTSFGSCPTGASAESTFQDYLNTGGTIQYTGMTPCTITLTSALTIGLSATITIDGGVGLTLDQTTSTNDVIDIGDSAASPSTLALDQVTVENGANGIFDGMRAATVTLTQSTVRDNGNVSGGNGGDGIAAGTVTLTDSTVSDNGMGSGGLTVDTGGGGAGIQATTVTLTDSTISDNGAGVAGGSGGNGIGATTVSLTDSTVSGNGAGVAGGNGGNGIFATTVNLTASILANPGATNCQSPTSTDGGYNLSTDSSCGFASSTSLPNTTATTPPTSQQLNLLPLGNYGGPTETIALGPGSIAIDQVPVGTTATINGQSVIICPSATDPAFTDQRGIERPQGPKCDIGAYEAPAVTIATTPANPASSGWYTASQLGNGGKLPVSVSFTGLATGELPTCSGATFTGLPTTAVTGLNQSANGSASLGDGSYTISCGVSQVGQTTTALGVSSQPAQPLTLKIDTTLPVITSPVANGQYLANQHVTLTCADPSAADGATGSGIQTCAVTVKEPNGTTTTVQSGADVPTSQTGSYTVTPNTVTDVAGNADTTSFTYIVSYQLVPMPGNTATVNHGYFALIRFAPEDANGHDEASRTLKVTSVELDGPNGQVIPFVHQFQFTMAHNTPQYQLELNTRNLSVGPWTLKVQIGTGATATTGTITFAVE